MAGMVAAPLAAAAGGDTDGWDAGVFGWPLPRPNSVGFSVLSRAGGYACLCWLIAIIGYPAPGI
jgi:hypothetical protein